MEGSGGRKWVLSVVAALVVGAVLVTGWWLARPGSGADAGFTGGPSAGASAGASGGVPADGTTGAAGGGASHQPADPGGGSDGRPGTPGDGPGDEPGDAPGGGRDPVLAEDRVRVDGYAVRGDRLVLRYTTGVPECYGSVAPRVAEDADAVTVSLVRVPPRHPADACIDLAVIGTVAVRLAAPLGARVVLDAGFDPPVVVRGAAGGQAFAGGES